MKKVVIKPGKKGVDALSFEDLDPHQLGPNDVCVRVHTTSLNYRDLNQVLMGLDQELIPLSDGAGVVQETGSAVTRLKKGDRVAGLFFPLWHSGSLDEKTFASARGGVPTDGMLAQLVYGHEDSFVKFPGHLSFEEASTLPCAGLTAWHALVVKGQLKPGQTVVIMGTGGVALFALQIAKTIGARVILISSSEKKLEKAKALGADELIDYKRNPNWEALVLEKTAQVGADLVLELGGGGTLARSLEAVKMSGRISLVGVLTGFEGQVNPIPILRNSITVNGIYVGSRDMQMQFHSALEVNGIHPIIDRKFSFDQVREAYAYMQSAQHFGKIIIQLD